MNAPAWALPDGGKALPSPLERSIEAVMGSDRGSRLYMRLSNTRLDNGRERRQPMRAHRFDAAKRYTVALLRCMNVMNFAAGKRDNGDVIGVKRSTLLGLDRYDRGFDAATRRFSRVAHNLEDAGFLDRKRRSGAATGLRRGQATGKPTLFLVAKQLMYLLGTLHLFDAERQRRGAAQARARAHLADATTDHAHQASSRARAGEAREPAPLSAYLGGAPPKPR